MQIHYWQSSMPNTDEPAGVLPTQGVCFMAGSCSLTSWSHRESCQAFRQRHSLLTWRNIRTQVIVGNFMNLLVLTSDLSQNLRPLPKFNASLSCPQ